MNSNNISNKDLYNKQISIIITRFKNRLYEDIEFNNLFSNNNYEIEVNNLCLNIKNIITIVEDKTDESITYLSDELDKLLSNSLLSMKEYNSSISKYKSKINDIKKINAFEINKIDKNIELFIYKLSIMYNLKNNVTTYKILVSILNSLKLELINSYKTILNDKLDNILLNINMYLKDMLNDIEEELNKEIEKDRLAHGKKPLKKKDDNQPPASGGTGNDKDSISEELPEDVKTQKCSISDPESGWFRKGEHKHVFAYAVETACDKHGWILGYTVHPGNEHDSRTFKALYDKISKLNPQMVVADAGYKTPAIAHQLSEDGIQPLFPYTRPKTKEGFFGKHEFAYDEYYDCYICPGAHILTYSTTNRNGYKEYKSCGEHCAECQYLSKCTESKDHVKLITRHVWEEYMEVAEDIRHTIGNRQIYQLRKETIERIFGTAKEQHGFRYTQYVGKARMEMKAGLTFACMNLKKLAKILEKRDWNTARFLLILKKIKRKEVLKEKWCWI